METTAKQMNAGMITGNVYREMNISKHNVLAEFFSRQAQTFESNRFVMMTLFMTIQSCLGSIATFYLLQNAQADVWFILTAAITMACNAVLIAQGSAKLCLAILYASLIFNTAMILAYL
jgi:hypothetical protein